jgi:hypothetical protein
MRSLCRLLRVFALGAFALACGSRTSVDGVTGASAKDAGASEDDAGASFPVGTYTRCAFGTVASGPLLVASGFDSGATLTVSRSGGTRTATYVDQDGRSEAWTFATTTSASAALAPSGQRTRGFGSSLCVYGVGVSNEKFFPTNVDAASGAMTYESGAVFISLQGELTSHTDCGDVSVPASVWIGCTGGPLPAPAVSAPASAPPFPVGDYACKSQVGTRATLGGTTTIITSGASGALTLTQAGAHVTAHYASDTELTGALDLTPLRPPAAPPPGRPSPRSAASAPRPTRSRSPPLRSPRTTVRFFCRSRVR